jgi:O-antigen ligase
MTEILLYAAVGLFAVTVVGLAVNPIYGIPLLFISKPIIDTTFAMPLVFGFKLTELIAVAVPLVILAHMIMGSSDRSLGHLPFKFLWLPYVAYILLFSMFIAYNQDLREGASVFFRYLNGFIGFYMLQAFFLSDERRKWLFRSLIAAGLFPVGVGLFQLVTGVAWRVEQSEGVLRNIGLWHDAVNIRQYTLQTLLALLLYSAVYVGARVWRQCAMLLYIVATIMVCIKAYSKAGLAILGLWTGCWGLLFRKYAVVLIPVMSVLLLGGLWVADLLNNVLQVFQKEIGFVSGDIAGTRTFAGRWFSWQLMLNEWQRYDWFMKLFGSGKVATGAHNDYLQMLFHGGIVGLSFYVALLGTIGMKLMINLRQALSPMNLVAFMAFLMWMVDTIGLVPSAYPGYQWFVWGLIGLSLRLHATAPQGVGTQQAGVPVTEPLPELLSLAGSPLGSTKKFPLLSP